MTSGTGHIAALGAAGLAVVAAACASPEQQGGDPNAELTQHALAMIEQGK